VHFLFGGGDKSSAVPQGFTWGTAITSASSHACVSTAPHELPNDVNGATQIGQDLINMCVVQP
jgi:hypothetical protein